MNQNGIIQSKRGNMKEITIAIDGPSGSGKSTVANMVAQKLGILYLNTGALYRAIGIKAYRLGLTVNQVHEIEKYLQDITIDVQYHNGNQYTYLNGEDVSQYLKGEIADTYSAAVSDCLPVREKILEIQRKIATQMSVVMEGRDIGSVVLPNAPYKFFITASLAIRAKRRFLEYQSKGIQMTLQEVEEGLKERDEKDEHRKHSPLIIPKNAIIIHTDEKSVEEIVHEIILYVRGK